MGYVWAITKNVIVKGVVHGAVRDSGDPINQGKIVLFCEVSVPKFRRRKSFQRTQRNISCMLCINEVA